MLKIGLLLSNYSCVLPGTHCSQLSYCTVSIYRVRWNCRVCVSCKM